MIRGRPRIEQGGSSGWITSSMPASSATGQTSLRKYIRLERSWGDVLIAVKLFLELLQGKALFRTGQAGNHVAYQQLPVVFRHLLEAGFGPGLFRVGVIGFRTGALQQEEVESDEGRAFEAQARLPSGSS